MYTVTEVNPVPKRKESYLIVRYLIDLATCCDLPNQRVIPSEVGVVELSDPAYFFFFFASHEIFTVPVQSSKRDKHRYIAASPTSTVAAFISCYLGYQNTITMHILACNA